MNIDRILNVVDAITSFARRENEKRKFWMTILGIIFGIAAVAAIGYGIYRFLTPDYFDDYDDDDDFDDDDFDDEFEDDFEDDVEVAAEA